MRYKVEIRVGKGLEGIREKMLGILDDLEGWIFNFLSKVNIEGGGYL